MKPTYIGYKIPRMDKITQILHISTIKTIFITNSIIKLDLLHTNATAGVGGLIFNSNLFCSKLGLEDQNLKGKLNL